ncbi:hypothetical protein [Muriicola sp.]|uniref:hypothetical protein n=1 Tax=Muriicola sp. TaxID=2020856 RepID=UPI003C735EBD
MKKVFFLFIATFSLIALPAQNPNEIELFKARFNSEKTELVGQFIDLTANEGVLFWPLYKAYEAERSGNANKRIALLYQYVNFYETLTNAQAKALYNDVLKLQQSEIALKKKYNKKMGKALSPLIALRFFQLEEFIQSEIRTAILENIPLLDNY